LWDKLTGVCYKTVFLGLKNILTSLSFDRGFIAVSSQQLIMILKISKSNNDDGKVTTEVVQSYKEHLKR
jgi:hypothetical protein